MNKIKDLYMKMPAIMRYFLNSCFVTVIDVAIVWMLYSTGMMNIVAANTVGVVAGFLIDYVLSVKFVFDSADSIIGFIVYLGTFFIGLVLADWLILMGETRFFLILNDGWRFLFSKGLSIVVPFFVMYFIRKGMYLVLDKRKKRRGENYHEI